MAILDICRPETELSLQILKVAKLATNSKKSSAIMGQKCGGHYYNTEAYTGTIEGSLRVKQAELETNIREV